MDYTSFNTVNNIIGALSRLDDFLMNTLTQGHSGTTPETSRNANGRNQGMDEEDSQSDPHPEAGIFHNQTTRNSGSEKGHDMVAGVHDEVTYCSSSTSSGSRNRTALPVNRKSAARIPLQRSKQTKLALEHLANNNDSANFHNNINRSSKMQNSLTTAMRLFDGKSEKFELFEDLFPTSLKVHNHLTEDDRINYIHSLMRRDALHTFKNNNGTTQKNLGEFLAVIRRKFVKPQSMATAKHKFLNLSSLQQVIS